MYSSFRGKVRAFFRYRPSHERDEAGRVRELAQTEVKP
jgi:hypothetical protein